MTAFKPSSIKAGQLFLLALFFLYQEGIHSQIQGMWHSNFQVAGKSLLMDLQIEGIGRDGQIVVSIPDQPKMKPQNMDEFHLFSDSLWFAWKMIGLEYSAKLQGDSLVGTMKQSGLSWRAVFYKEIQLQKAVEGKIQDPKAPFPYAEQEVVIKINNKVELAGTLCMPQTNALKKFPLVIMVSGSGPQDRDCEIFGHRSFWVLADHLARVGIASYRYDDRGAGSSTGVFENSDQVDFANDLRAIVQHFTKIFPEASIYIYGHSEGGMTALRAAVHNTPIQGIIEAASVGTSGAEVLYAQQYLIPQISGYNEQECLWNQRLYQKGGEIALHTKRSEFENQYATWLDEIWDSIPKKLLQNGTKKEVLFQMNAFFNNAWARQFLAFEARSYLEQLSIPFLVINGSNDVQVPAKSNQDGFKSAMSPSSLQKSTFYILEGANHLFQQCHSCTIPEYAELEQTIDPQVLTWISAWVLEQQKAHR